MNGGHIDNSEEMIRYFDKNGVELHAGDSIVYPDGSIMKLYLTVDGELGTDATNPSWIETGRACECEFGIYPLTEYDVEVVEKL